MIPQIYPLPNKGPLPLTSLNLLNPLEVTASHRTLAPTTSLLDQLKDSFEFRCRLAVDESLVAYFFVGRLDHDEGEKGEWCGLVGLSVETAWE